MIYELETQHNKTRQQYEEDINRLRNELVQARQAAQVQAQHSAQAQQAQAPGLLSHPSAAGGPGGGPPPPPGSIPPSSTSPHVPHAAAMGHPGPAYGETPYAYRGRDERDMRDARDVRDVRDRERDRDLREARDARDMRDIRDIRSDPKERDLRDREREREMRDRDERGVKRIKTERGKGDRLGILRILHLSFLRCLYTNRLRTLIGDEALPRSWSLCWSWSFDGAPTNTSSWRTCVSCARSFVSS